MERVDSSYSSPIVDASMSALLELSMGLRSFSDALVLVGGWVPYFLLRDHRASDSDFEHVGSIDIDLVVDHDKIGSDGSRPSSRPSRTWDGSPSDPASSASPDR